MIIRVYYFFSIYKEYGFHFYDDATVVSAPHNISE